MQKERGFNIIELVVVVTIIGVLLLVAIANFPQTKLQFALSRSAYKFEQDVRRTQDMTLSYEEQKDSGGVPQPVSGFGVYIDLDTLGNKKYIIYADRAPGNQVYDALDYIVETIDLSQIEPGVIIKQIANVTGNIADVYFAPPNPTIKISPLAPQSCQNAQQSIDIIFALESDPAKTKTVAINTSGLVQVGPLGSFTGSFVCDDNLDCGTSGFVGGLFCQGNNVYQNYTVHTCNNPCTSSASCSESTTPYLQQTCSSGGGVSWVEVQPGGDADKSWDALASSSDGTHLIAGASLGRLYLSADSGQTWTETRPVGNIDERWWAVASNADGSRLIAGLAAGRLYISSNFGQTWTETQPAGDTDQSWNAIASSADGSRLIAGVEPGRLYVSSNFGASWLETQPRGNTNQLWMAVASSADGSRLVAATMYHSVLGYVGSLNISTDYGQTWTEAQPVANPTVQFWNTVASSSAGSHLIAGVWGRRLYTSIDFGQTWAETRPAGDIDRNWQTVSSSADGSRLIAGVYGGRLYASANSGQSWIETQPAGNANKDWSASASSADGIHLIAGVFSGRLYISQDTVAQTCSSGVCTP